MKSTKLVPLFVLVIGLFATFASRADAQCGPQNQRLLAFAKTFHTTGGRVTTPQSTDDRFGAQLAPEASADASIVGLWDVQIIIDGEVVDEGFDQYHSDGTEILNDTPPPATGNVCLGVYSKTGKRTIKLKHPSWIYDATNTTVVARATILEDITLDSSGNSFTGTFTFQLRDLTGNVLAPDVSGQIKGVRIAPE
ncbi:MAG TPA: hypothetical protein VGL29_14925 [Blastocatellia bacterium]|jgi:hypothetical protein